MKNSAYSNRMVVLAEDDEDDQEFIRDAIKKINPTQELHVANNGKELLDYVHELKDNQVPCLFVIDLNMPVMDGWQTLDELNRLPKFSGVPKVIFTTSDMEQDKKKALKNGATLYLTKPSNMTDVVKSVGKILGYCQ